MGYNFNMNYLEKLFKHLHTINTHRRLVRKLCFKCGMYRQGLLHDLSKYSFEEFFPSVKYFQGYRSPISAEKETVGYSKCYMHHKGRNKHHWEYWTDMIKGDDHIHAFPMPDNYMLESVLDKIAASKVYKKEAYTTSYPYEFFIKSHENKLMNPKTAHDIGYLLKYLSDNGEEKALKYYKELYRQYKKDKSIRL